MYDIAVMGNSIVDALVHTTEDVLLKHGLKKADFQTRELNDFMALNDDCMVEKFESGGSIANTAYALGKLGSKVAFISRFGADTSGKHFKSDMINAGVTVSNGEDSVKTMEVFVLITPDGERTFVSPGTTAPVSANMVDEEKIKQSKWLLIEGYLLFDQYEAVKKALKIARKHGVKTALTLASSAVLNVCFNAVETEIDNGLDLIIANKEELTALIKAATEHGDKLLQQVHDTPSIVTSSGDGATYTDKQNELNIPTTKIDSPVDTTGAGDAFAAGFLHHYITHNNIENGIKLGHKLASEVIMRTGARVQDSMLS